MWPQGNVAKLFVCVCECVRECVTAFVSPLSGGAKVQQENELHNARHAGMELSPGMYCKAELSSQHKTDRSRLLYPTHTHTHVDGTHQILYANTHDGNNINTSFSLVNKH